MIICTRCFSKCFYSYFTILFILICILLHLYLLLRRPEKHCNFIVYLMCNDNKGFYIFDVFYI